MTSNDPAYYKEYLWNEIKNSFAGFERANDYTDPNNYIKLIRKDGNPINLYIHGINVEGELYHRKITRNNSALDKVTLNDEIYCSTAKYAAEFKHLFEYGPYGVAAELAISKDAELTPDGNGNYTSDDLIWVKFFQDEYNPDKFVLDFGNDDYKINGIRNVMNFVGLRVYPDSRTVMLRRNPVYKSPAYSTIEPSNDFNPNIVSDVSLAPVFYRSILDEDYRRCKWDGYGLLAGTVVGGQPDRNINPSDYHSKIPTNMVDSKYYGRNSDWGGNIARRIITGYPVKTSGMLLYPIENSDGSIDYYPFKMMVGVPEKYLSQDTILNRDLKELLRRYNPPQDNIRYLKSAVNVAEIDAIDTDRVNVFDSTSIIEMFRELVFALIRIKGDNASVRREVVARRNFDRAGWRAEDGQPLWDLTKKWFTSDDVEPTQMKFSHLIGPDLNNIAHEHYSRTLKSGTISAARLREWYLNVLIDATKRSFYPSVESFFTNLSNGIENIYHKEIAGTSVASPTYESTPEILYDVDSGTFINRITPVNRPTKPENDAPRAEREQYNTLVDNYNTYVDKLNVRYGNFDYMKISESDKFDLSLPYQVKMPPEQFGNPQYDKPIDGMNPGDLIGFIAEMVYGIQNNDSVNVLNAIPGIYVPAVIPEQFRYLGRRDDVIKNQFTRTLNKWIELKPKPALVRDELDAIDDLVNELIMLSGNPTTPSGLEDGSVYSLSTLFKGSLRKERFSTTTNSNNRYEYNITFLRRDADTGRVYYRISRRNGEPMAYDRTSVTTRISSSIALVYDGHDSYYLTADQIENDHDITVSFEVHELDERALPHQYTVESVIIPGNPRLKPEYTPGYNEADPSGKPPVDLGGGAVTNKPVYSYRIVHNENGWILSTEPIASFNVERVDGGSLPDNIEIRYNDRKYGVSGGRIGIPNNDLPAHDKTVSMKVAYNDDPSDAGSVVSNVTLPAHHPHEFLIENFNRSFTTGLVTYRVKLSSLNRINEDISVYHEDVRFDTSRADDGSGDFEFSIPNILLPKNDEVWDFEVRYEHFGEMVTSLVRSINVNAKLQVSKPASSVGPGKEPNGTVDIVLRDDDRPSGTFIPYRPKVDDSADGTDTRFRQPPPPQ